jgi:hypothetical protein
MAGGEFFPFARGTLIPFPATNANGLDYIAEEKEVNLRILMEVGSPIAPTKPFIVIPSS